MLSAGSKLTIPAFERAKTVHALDRAATVIGPEHLNQIKMYSTTTKNHKIEALKNRNKHKVKVTI
jgi:hypothetical protein